MPSAFQLYFLNSNLKIPLGALSMCQHFLNEYTIDDLNTIFKDTELKETANNTRQLQQPTGDLIQQLFWTWGTVSVH